MRKKFRGGQYIQLLLTETFRFLYAIVDSTFLNNFANVQVLLTETDPQYLKVFVYTKVCKLLHKPCVDKCITKPEGFSVDNSWTYWGGGWDL